MPIESVKFTPYPGAIQRLRQSRDGEFGKYLYKRGLRLKALAQASVPKRTGQLASSIEVKFFAGVKDCFVTIGSDKSYAYYVHEGTKPHNINGNSGRVIRFANKGQVVYARKVNHPGTKPNRFLSRHLRSVIK